MTLFRKLFSHSVSTLPIISKDMLSTWLYTWLHHIYVSWFKKTSSNKILWCHKHTTDIFYGHFIFILQKILHQFYMLYHAFHRIAVVQAKKGKNKNTTFCHWIHFNTCIRTPWIWIWWMHHLCMLTIVKFIPSFTLMLHHHTHPLGLGGKEKETFKFIGFIKFIAGWHMRKFHRMMPRSRNKMFWHFWCHDFIIAPKENFCSVM